MLLDVPNLSVDEITLEVENLRARVSLDARLANLLQLTAGADAGIDKVKLTIKGVRAELLLKVRLDNVAAIIDRTLTTIDRNPQILERLLQSVDTRSARSAAAQKACSRAAWSARRSARSGDSEKRDAAGGCSADVNRSARPCSAQSTGTGNIVERTLDAAGGRRQPEHRRERPRSDELSRRPKEGARSVSRVRDTGGAIIG